MACNQVIRNSVNSDKVYSKAELIFVTIVLAIATFMQVLDTTIANVAIPTIAGDLGVSTTQGTWVITGFGVSNAISIAASGFFAKRMGEVRLLIWSTLLFTLFSFLSGMATDMTTLIIFRVLQGAVAGPVIPLSQSLILRAYPRKLQSLAMAFWGMTVILAPVLGPILGGYISDNFDWSWIFFINVPLGIFVVLVGAPLLKRLETKPENYPFSYIAFALLIIGVGSLQILLDQGEQWGWWGSNGIRILIVISVVALIYFFVMQIFDKNPIIDFSLFKSLNFSISTLCISLAYLVYFGAIVLIPQLLQMVYGYTALWAGIVLAPLGILPVVLVAYVAKLCDRMDLRVIVTFSFILYAVCFFWRAAVFTPDIPMSAVIWPQLLQGLALTCFLMPLTTLGLQDIPDDKLAAATSVQNFLRTLAGSIGTSITTTMWNDRAILHHSHLAENINLYNPNVANLYGALEEHGLSQFDVSTVLNTEITSQSLIMSANDIFWLSGWIFIVLIGLVWFAKPKKSAA